MTCSNARKGQQEPASLVQGGEFVGLLQDNDGVEMTPVEEQDVCQRDQDVLRTRIPLRLIRE